MPKKGKAKNTTTKAKYNRLMQQKVNKVKLEKQRHKERIKALIKKNKRRKTAFIKKPKLLNLGSYSILRCQFQYFQ